MIDFKQNVIKTFNSYKCTSKSDDLKQIPIYIVNDLVGFLIPVTFLYKKTNPEYVHLFGKWRRENPEGFATIFEISDTRTEYWLDNILLNREDRILFVISNLKGEPLGHLGYSSFNFEERNCEIDNVVRGVKGVQKGIMSCAINTLIRWGKSRLNLENIFLRVLSDNPHAIRFYEKNGFFKQFEIPLYKTTQNNEVRWIETRNFKDQIADRFFTYMKFIENI